MNNSKNIQLLRKSLYAFTFALISFILQAQTTGTYVVTNKPSTLMSCQDTLITLEDIFRDAGIQDLNDPNDDVSQYRILELNGSLITENELTTFKYSDYPAVYIQKTNTALTGHNGVQIYLRIIERPDYLFTEDTLEYTVDLGKTVFYTEDLVSHMNFWSSLKDETPLQDRILFKTMPSGTEVNWGGASGYLGVGLYRVRMSVSVCYLEDIMEDSIFINILQSPCTAIDITGMSPVCSDEIIDIRPYVYVNGIVATTQDLDLMVFKDRTTSSTVLNPSNINVSQLLGTGSLTPAFSISYQPNEAFGSQCPAFTYNFQYQLPTELPGTTVVLFQNLGKMVVYQLDGATFYSFNNIFDKNIIVQNYISNFAGFTGSVMDFYRDDAYTDLVIGNNLTEGDYYVKVTNPNCPGDETYFENIHIVNRDFQMTWQAQTNIGQGYVQFTAPEYADATYTWMIWGGSIVNGLGTREITVYFSEDYSQGVFATCMITLSSSNMRTTGENILLFSSIYLNTDENGEFIEHNYLTTSIDKGIDMSEKIIVYPNPTSGELYIKTTLSSPAIVRVYNTTGQVVFEDEAYTSEKLLYLSTPGVYSIQLVYNNQSIVKKVVVN